MLSHQCRPDYPVTNEMVQSIWGESERMKAMSYTIFCKIAMLSKRNGALEHYNDV
jgi:hypothetical protein